MTRSWRKAIPTIILGGLLAVVATERGEAQEAGPATPLRVAAASDLQHALPVLAKRFTDATKVKVDLTFGASGQLTEQIKAGAPFDVFLSANQAFVRDLAAAGFVRPRSVAPYARGALVLAVHRASGGTIQGLADLTRPEVKKIALPNPAFAPYGAAGMQAMERAGIWNALTASRKIVRAASVREALRLVETGNTEAGLVGRSIADVPGVRVVAIDPALYDPIIQAQGIVSKTIKGKEAEAFTEFVLGDAGQAVLAEFGFAKADGGKRINRRDTETQRHREGKTRRRIEWSILRVFSVPLRLCGESRFGVGEVAWRSFWEDLAPLWLSLRVATLATVAIVAIGVPLALVLARGRFPGKGLLAGVLVLPLVLPPTVLGYYLLQLLGRRGWLGAWIERTWDVTIVFHWSGAVVASTVAAFPIFLLPARGAFEEVDPALEDAARLLGRREISVFLSVTLPLAWRGLAAGIVLAFARALGDFGATMMVAGDIPGLTQTASMAIFDAVQVNDAARAGSLTLWISSIAIAALWAAQRTLPARGARR